MRRGRNCRQRIDAKAPAAQRNTSSGYRIVAADGKCGLEDRVVGLLLHEQRDVLEGVVIVHAKAGADDVISMSVQVIGQADAGAEAFAVVSCFFGDQGSCQRAEWSNGLQLLEGAAVSNLR